MIYDVIKKRSTFCVLRFFIKKSSLCTILNFNLLCDIINTVQPNTKKHVIYYNEIYKDLEPNISDEMLAEHYNNAMRNAYMGNKLQGIIPCMNIYEFLNKLKEEE